MRSHAHRLFAASISLFAVAACSDREAAPVASSGTSNASASVSASAKASAASAAPETPVGAFWTWVARNVATINNDPATASKELSTRLATVDPGLVWEVTPSKDGSRPQLVIPADGDEELFPKVREVVNAAPQFEGLEVLAFKQRGLVDGTKIDLGGLSVLR